MATADAPPGPAARALVLSDLNMMVRTGGLERSEGHFAALLARAGLRLARIIPMAGGLSLVDAAPA